jgi:hypothetical protein
VSFSPENLVVEDNNTLGLIEHDRRSYIINTGAKTTYKIAPLGFIHFDLNADSIIIMGGFYNQCITNVITLIGRSLGSSNQEGLLITLPTGLTFSQTLGVNKSIDIAESNTFELSNLVESDSYNEFKLNHKAHLEKEMYGLVEVLYGDEEKKQPSKKTLRINITYK